MEAEEEVRGGEGWAPGAGAELGFVLQLLFLSLSPKSAWILLCPSASTAVPVLALLCVATLDICSRSVYLPFLPSLRSPSGPFRFTLEVVPRGADGFLRPGPCPGVTPSLD